MTGRHHPEPVTARDVREGWCLGCHTWRPIEDVARHYGRCSPECVQVCNRRRREAGLEPW